MTFKFLSNYIYGLIRDYGYSDALVYASLLITFLFGNRIIESHVYYDLLDLIEQLDFDDTLI